MADTAFEQRFKWSPMKSSKRGAVRLLRDLGRGWCILGVQVYRDGDKWAVVMKGRTVTDHADTCDDAKTNAEQRVRRWYTGEVEFVREAI